MEVKAGYQQTQMGLIPADWVDKRLGAVATIAAGGTPSRRVPEYWDGEIPWVTTKEIGFNTIRFAEESISAAGLKNSAAKLLAPGTLLLALYGQGKTRGKVASLGLRAATNQACASIAVAPSMSSTFVFHFLASRYESIRGMSNAGSQENLSGQIVKSIWLPIPPTKAEQEAIAEALSDADALIESLEQLLVKKRQIKQGTMQELLTGKRRLPGFDGEWSVKRIGEICDISMGRTPSRLNSAYWGKGYKWLSIADLKSKIVSDAKEEITALAAEDMQIIQAGTLLMSFKLSIGRLCFAGCDLYTNEAICSFNNLKAVADYLYYVLGRTDFSLYGKQAVKGHTLNKESLSAIEVPFPSMQEQSAIAAILSDMDADIAALESRLAKARHIKQGMMQQLLTGKIRLV